MKLIKLMKENTLLMIVSSSLLLLSGCSSFGLSSTKGKPNTFSALKKQYNSYQYSSYVEDSLMARAPIVDETPNLNEKKLKAVARQFSNKKKHSANHIAGVRNQNGIYKPKRSLQQQTARLNTQKKAESWLKTHSSLDAVLTLALKSNLDIQSAQLQAKSSLEKYDQVGFLDDMLSQYASFTKDIKLSGSTQKHKKSVTASFPFPGLLSLKSRIIDQAVEASRLQLKQIVQDVITSASIAYTEMQYAQQELVITKKKIKVLNAFKEELKSNYSTNTAELSGVLDADIKIAENKNKLQVAVDKQKAEQAKLNALLHLSPAFSLGRLDSLKPNKVNMGVQALIEKAQAHRVEIARLRVDLKKMAQVIQLSEKRFYPDFDAGYSRFQNNEFTTRPKIKNSNFFAKNDAYLKETRQKYKALQIKVKALENKTADDIQRVYSSYQSQDRTRVLYQSKVLPKAKTTLQIAKDLFETGETSFLEVIDSDISILDYQLKLYAALKGVNISGAKLVRLVGKEIPK